MYFGYGIKNSALETTNQDNTSNQTKNLQDSMPNNMHPFNGVVNNREVISQPIELKIPEHRLSRSETQPQQKEKFSKPPPIPPRPLLHKQNTTSSQRNISYSSDQSFDQKHKWETFE